MDRPKSRQGSTTSDSAADQAAGRVRRTPAATAAVRESRPARKRGRREHTGHKSAAPDGRAGLSLEQLERFDEAFAGDPKNILALNAVTGGKLQQVARNREAVIRAQRTFSHVVKTAEITDQKQSGRCWMFAGLNVLRVEAMKRLKVEQFEFSQNYLMFYDKLEKANYFLETVIETADEPTDGRLIAFLLAGPDPGRRAVGHVRQPGAQVRRGAQERHARERVEQLVDGHERRRARQAARVRRRAASPARRGRVRRAACANARRRCWR